jgi:hypothetical protein
MNNIQKRLSRQGVHAAHDQYDTLSKNLSYVKRNERVK